MSFCLAQIKIMWGWFLQALFPQRCAVCGAEGAVLCVAHNALVSFPPDTPLEAGESLDQVWAVTTYQDPTVATLVGQLKFYRQWELGEMLGRTMRQALGEEGKEAVLVPIPLHWRRRWWRGYNQSAELAKGIDPMRVKPILRRTRHTQQQARLRGEERRENLRGAFAVVVDVPLPAHVVLVDDVATTGSTLSEAARVLKEAGVQRVDAVVWARSLPSGRRQWEDLPRGEGLPTKSLQSSPIIS